MQYINRTKSRKANNQRMKPCVHSPIRKSSVFGNEVDIETMFGFKRRSLVVWGQLRNVL